MNNNRGNKNAASKVGQEGRPEWLDWTESTPTKLIKFIERYIIVPKGHGAGKPIKLAVFQKKAIHKMFGKGIRTAEFSLGRGNGKSTFMAAVALAHLFLTEFSPQVPLVATTLRQIEIGTYNVCIAMVKASPELNSRCITYSAIGNKKLITPYNNGELFPISSDVDGLQGLDPSLALVDEVGFISEDAWDALRLAGGKRPTSLVCGLGTTGTDDSALYRLHTQWQEGLVLPGHVRINYSAPDDCDITDQKMWRLANPALAEGFLAKDALKADLIQVPEWKFRAFRLNQWVEIPDDVSWLGSDALSVWRDLADTEYEFDPDMPSFLGVDVALKWDTAAVVRVQETPKGTYHAQATIFRPDGGSVDLAQVRAAIREVPNLKACAYDPRFFESSAQDLSNEGVPMIEVAQSPQNMVPAIGFAYRTIMAGKLTHDGDPQFAYQVTNATPRESEGGYTLKKRAKGRKIDACIAMCLALFVAARQEEESVNLMDYVFST